MEACIEYWLFSLLLQLVGLSVSTLRTNPQPVLHTPNTEVVRCRQAISAVYD